MRSRKCSKDSFKSFVVRAFETPAWTDNQTIKDAANEYISSSFCDKRNTFTFAQFLLTVKALVPLLQVGVVLVRLWGHDRTVVFIAEHVVVAAVLLSIATPFSVSASPLSTVVCLLSHHS